MKKLSAVLLPALLLFGGVSESFGQEAKPAAQAPAPVPTPVAGQLSEADLGNMLSALGLKPKKTEKRYDFEFKTSLQGEEWKFSMSAVLSQNGESIWVMAWLDQIPQTANDVPRTALLRLLSANDRLGNGKFFAYIPSNKRFVLQRVVKNENMDSKALVAALQDLAVSVADEYPIWSVENWKKSDAAVADQAASGRAMPSNPTAASRANPAGTQGTNPQRTSEAASKFDGKRVE